jgi:hypothetical protein
MQLTFIGSPKSGPILSQCRASNPNTLRINETVLSFQLRTPINQLEKWDPARRATYLLREEIIRPLSVDEAVWPCLKDDSLSREIFLDPEDSPNGLRLHSIKFKAALPVKNAAILLAITVQEPDANQLRARHKISSSLINVRKLHSHGFDLLGYDVADAWFASGLANCGYAPGTKINVSARYGKALNDYGLFSGIIEAGLFRVECDKRVPEHAPFTILGLWSCGG